MRSPFLALFAASLLVCGAAGALQRRVLALHKSSEGDTAASNLAASLLEAPLESLGLVVDHADADGDLPSDTEMSAYRGVVTFFRGPDMKNAAAYARWLTRQIRAGRRAVIVGDFGAFRDGTLGNLSHAEVNAPFQAMGLRYDGFGTSDPSLIRLERAHPAMSHEEPFAEASADAYVAVRPLIRSATSFLILTRTDIENGESHPVIATPKGGFAAAGILLHEYAQGGRLKQRWHLDPRAFLAAALGVANEPRLDAASLNGRRLWIAHIDGDGFLTPAGPGRLCGQAMLDDVLRAYPLPFSVSIIASDLGKDKRAPAAAREIFSLPNVEAASHSDTHPLDWSARETDGAAEVKTSVEKLSPLLPPGKKIRLVTWTGLCNPTAAALAAAEALGLANINGVNSEGGFVNRFDRLFPSRTHLSPMARHVAGMLQFNHLAANDFDLTDRWQDGRLGQFRRIIETFEKTTARPERPAHVYFHFYSAHTPESLAALTAVLDWSRRRRLARIFAGDYVRMVEDFRSARLSRGFGGHLRVQNAGHARTVVLPGASGHVDMDRSIGVIGYAPRDGGLYVFLDGSRDHLIVPAAHRPDGYFVRAAEGWIDRWSVSGATATLAARAFGETRLTLGVPAEGRYELTVRAAGAAGPGVSLFEKARNGEVTFRFDASGRDVLTVRPAGGRRAFARLSGVPVLALSLAAFPLWFFVRARRRLNA